MHDDPSDAERARREAEDAWIALTEPVGDRYPALNAVVQRLPDGLLISADTSGPAIDMDPTVGVAMSTGWGHTSILTHTSILMRLGADGRVLWQHVPPDHAGGFSATADPSGSLFLVRHPRRLSLLDAGGQERWSWEGDTQGASAAISREGGVYLTTPATPTTETPRGHENGSSRIERFDASGVRMWEIPPEHRYLQGCGRFRRIHPTRDGGVVAVGGGFGRVRYGGRERRLSGWCRHTDARWVPGAIMWLRASPTGEVLDLGSINENRGYFMLSRSAVDASGALYLAGYARRIVDVDPGPEQRWVEGADDPETQLVLLRIETDGRLGFVQVWPGVSIDSLTTRDDRVILTITSWQGAQIGRFPLPARERDVFYRVDVASSGDVERVQHLEGYERGPFGHFFCGGEDFEPVYVDARACLGREPERLVDIAPRPVGASDGP